MPMHKTLSQPDILTTTSHYQPNWPLFPSTNVFCNFKCTVLEHYPATVISKPAYLKFCNLQQCVCEQTARRGTQCGMAIDPAHLHLALVEKGADLVLSSCQLVRQRAGLLPQPRLIVWAKRCARRICCLLLAPVNMFQLLLLHLSPASTQCWHPEAVRG